MATAISSTASPASCPSMRREPSGSVAESRVALCGALDRWPPRALLFGETVGNRSEGLVGVVSAPSGRPGIDRPGRSKLGRLGIVPSGEDPSADVPVLDPVAVPVPVPVLALVPDPVDPVFGAEATVTVAWAWMGAEEDAFAAATVAVRVICVPAFAFDLTAVPARTS
jgi:hypothetical protein